MTTKLSETKKQLFGELRSATKFRCRKCQTSLS